MVSMSDTVTQMRSSPESLTHELKASGLLPEYASVFLKQLTGVNQWAWMPHR